MGKQIATKDVQQKTAAGQRVAAVRADEEFAKLLPLLEFRVPVKPTEPPKKRTAATFKLVKGLAPECVLGHTWGEDALTGKRSLRVVTTDGEWHEFDPDAVAEKSKK